MEELVIICKLVRMSVFGTEEDIPLGVNWPKVFVDAGTNGVCAVCYEAVKRLPPDCQPDFCQMLSWDLSSQGIREGFHYRHRITGELRSLLENEGVSMLLLKGETLADNYPVPDLRESGDVDFVPLPDTAACDDFLTSRGIKLTFQEKHSSFIYGDVHFERHTLEPTSGFNRVHHRTYTLLRESIPDAVRRPDGCLELEPVTQAVFVVKHTAQHICYSGGKISLRMLLDLALLLKCHHGILESWEPQLKKVGLLRFAEVMLCATDQLLETGFRDDWSRHQTHRAKRFSELFLTESNQYVRYFAKFGFLPLRPSEVLRLLYEKAFMSKNCQ